MNRADDCPDLETLAAYLDGRLKGRDRDRVTAHAADCDTCYFVIAETARMPLPAAGSERRSAWREWLTLPKVVWPTAAALATAAMVWLAVGTAWLRPASPDLQQLVAAVGTDRTIEARLTGGFAYGPLRGPVRGAESVNVSPDVRIAAA